MLKTFCWTVAVLFMLQGCSSGDEWIVYNEIEISGDWDQEDALRLALTPTNDSKSDVYIEVTHTSEFGFENIYLKYILSQHGKIIAEDMVSIPLMSKEGFWTGKKSGKKYSSDKLIGSYDLTQPITVEVQQHSRQSQLAGIKSIGLGVR